MKHNINDINIGDEVIFESTKLQSNHDEYWKVIGKSNNHLMIELKKFGFDENWTIDISEVLYVLPLGKKDAK